jgi:hypothetical protein
MSAVKPAGEAIVAKRLQEALERLRDDVARVEIWAGALGCFAEPVPDYDPANSLRKFALPKRSRGPQGKSGVAASLEKQSHK